MRFRDLAIGESFQFDDPELNEFRYVKVGYDAFKSYPSRGLDFRLDEENINYLVKNVGAEFNSGLTLHFPAGHLVWRDENQNAVSKNISLEDVINAGYANQPRYANFLVLLPDHPSSKVELVCPVRRIDEKTLEFMSDATEPDHLSIVRVDGGRFFKRNDRVPDLEIEITHPRSSSIRKYLENESRYENAKTLAECEREYLAARQHAKLVVDSGDPESSVPAKAWTDDRNVVIEFNAAKWFEQASDDEIIALLESGFGNDYAADVVLFYMNGIDDKGAEDLFAYLLIVNKYRDKSNDPSKETVGFECHIDSDAAKAWIEHNRAHLMPGNALSCG